MRESHAKKQRIARSLTARSRGGVKKRGVYASAQKRPQQPRRKPSPLQTTRVSPDMARDLDMLIARVVKIPKFIHDARVASTQAQRDTAFRRLLASTGKLVETIAAIESYGQPIPDLISIPGFPNNVSSRKVHAAAKNLIEVEMNMIENQNPGPMLGLEEMYVVPLHTFELLYETIPNYMATTKAMVRSMVQWASAHTSDVVKNHSGNRFEKTMRQILQGKRM